MNRIQQIEVMVGVSRIYVTFKDRLDVKYNFGGRMYKPSFGALKMLSKVGKKMEVEVDFENGVTILRKRGENNDL